MVGNITLMYQVRLLQSLKSLSIERWVTRLNTSS